MKSYQIYEFSYIPDNDETTNQYNVLSGTKDECEYVSVPCFDGIAYFISLDGKYFKMTYPKMNNLSSASFKKIQKCAHHTPQSGEYGAVALTFGAVSEISFSEFQKIASSHPVKKRDICEFSWMK